MGRPRSFDAVEVVRLARGAFAARGYHATSIDDLLRATGLQRASLYHAFGSKRGLFLATLLDDTGRDDVALLLVALMDLSADDEEVREVVRTRVNSLGPDAEASLGRALLSRGRADHVTTDEQADHVTTDEKKE